ncbi:hypothetical protein [uncultured Eubacterium sp.]|uniref:hypothetical protein n=1 Tax=uncultured Eubacterium sp. TaxID=165185 RepID=UPI002672D8FD|nr:hypothetical protein [uncultured Eubacterium sp.]
MKNKCINIIKDSLKIVFLVYIVCLVYKLSITSVVICSVAAIIYNVFYEKQEKIRKYYLNKYYDVVQYMEQMIYSFKKQPKIREALSDAQKVSTERMKEIIEEVLVSIDSKATENIYEESLDIIGKEYDCKRLRSLHSFLIKIEKNGGEYETYINILLEDIKEWSDRLSLFIRDVNRVKRNVIISIFSTLITCGFMAYLIPKEYQYTNHIIYQIVSTVMIILMLQIFLTVNKKLNYNWIKEKELMPENMVMKYYSLVERGQQGKRELSLLERMSYKKAKKSLENEIKKAFPDWIRDVAINLQNETVQSAIENSYENAAFVLKRPIRKLLIDFERYPIGIEPYDNFLSGFDLMEIKSSMKMFYSINQLGNEQSDKQIDAIIDRNNKMTRQAEEMKNKDRIGIAGMFSAIPMLIGVGKIMSDMVLMIIVFTSSISNVINGG